MRIRRMLATLLCLAMIMTSGAFTTVVGAQEVNGQADDLTVSVEQEEPVVSGSEQAAEPVAEDPNAGAGQEAGEGNAEQPANDETVIGETPVQEEPEVPEAVEEPVEEEPEEIEEAEEAELVEEPEEAEETTEDEELLGVKPSEPTPGFSGTVLRWDLDTLMPETILLPEGVTEIPVGVFNLSNYDGGDNKNPLARNVKNIYFYDGDLATIAAGAFKNSNVAMIAFEDGTEVEIEQNAFDGCSNLKQIDLGGLETIEQNAFRGCAALSSVDLSSATRIEDGAFQNCTSLGNVTWCPALELIGEAAFSGCALTTLRIGDLNPEADAEGVVKVVIEDTAFSDNTKLTEVNLPVCLDGLSFGVFKNCEKLANVTFTGLTDPANRILSVEAEAFSGCVALQRIELPRNVESIGSKAFYGCEAKLLNIYFHTPLGRINFDENAFPGRSDTKATMYGYESTEANEEYSVKDYAASRGYKFKSLDTQYKVKSIVNVAGTITPSVKEARVGAEISLTVVPNRGYSFTNIKLKYTKDGSDFFVYPTLYKSTSQKQIWKFIMPEGDVTIDAKYDTAANILKGKLGWKFVPATAGEPDSNSLIFAEAGSSASIVVDVDGTEIGLWNFDLSTSDKEVATISQFGVITGLKKGTAIISLTSPTEKNKKIAITVQVGANATVDALLFDSYFLTADIKNATVIAPDPTGEDPYANPKYYVVEYNMNKLTAADHTFEPHVCAYYLNGADAPDPENPQPDDPKELFVNTAWTSRDTKLVTVGSAKSSLNENLITVKKGTYGETFVDVRYTNDDGTIIMTGFVVRIVNSTPRMKEDKIQVNAALQAGTDLNYENVYSYDFYKEGGLEVHTTRVVNGVPLYSYKPAFQASYQYDALGNVRGIAISANPKLLNLKEGGKMTFGGETMLYVEGKQARRGADGELDLRTLTTFHMPIKEVDVIYLKPKAALTYSGKLNLLYSIEADEEIVEKNFVSVFHNVKNIPAPKIENVEFMSEANYKFKQGKGAKEEPDKFAYNYYPAGAVYDTKLNEIGFKVRVNPAILVDSDFEKGSNGRIVSNGYASITFKGYNEPIIVPITIPCTYKFPNYALSRVRVVADSRRNYNPTYKVQIVDADTYPRKQVDLYEEDGTTSKISDDGLYQDVTASTPPGYFDEPVQLEREPVLDEDDHPVLDKDGNPLYKDYIQISAGGYARSGKERILLRMNGWRKPMSFDFTMTATTAMATAKCAPVIATVNTNTPTQEKEIKVSYNLAGTLKAADSEFVYVGPAGKEDAIKDIAETINLSWGGTDEEPVIKVSLPDGFERVGSYAFKTAPIAKYGDTGTPFEMKDIRFTVRVIETRPVLSLKPATFTLNTRYPNPDDDKGEVAVAETSVKNMPGDYEINIDGIRLVAITKDLPVGWRGDTINRDPNTNKIIYDDEGQPEITANGDWNTSIKFVAVEDEDGKVKKLGVKLLNCAHPDAFNYDYYMYGLRYGEADIQNPKPIRIRIACHDRFETLSLTPEGSLNQIIPGLEDPDPEIKADVPGYQIVYKETMKNLHGTVDAVKIAEVDPITRKVYENTYGKYSPHFKVEADPEEKTIILRLDEDNILGTNTIPALISGKSYQLFLYYHIPEKGTDDEYERVPITLRVTPTQVLPKLKQDTNSCKMYTGWSAEQRTFTVCVGKLTGHNAVFANAITEEDFEDPDDFDPHDTYGKQFVTKIADSAGAGIRRSFYVKTVDQWEDPDAKEGPLYMKNVNGKYVLDDNNHKIPCAYVTVACDQPAMLNAGTTYTIPIEIRYKDQDEKTKGTIINYKVKILK